MNKRIKLLAGQALDEAVPQTWTTLTADDLNKFTEKLAELIVKECADIVYNNNEITFGQSYTISNQIKNHFDIK